MYLKKAYQGVHVERHPQEPLERRFSERFQLYCDEMSGDPGTASEDFVRQLLNPPERSQNQPAPISDRDHQVVATVIQWLGSADGQGFLDNALDGKRPSSGRKVAFGRRRR